MSETTQSYDSTQQPDLPPPRSEVGVLGWLKHNLFSSPFNVVMTLAVAWFLWTVSPLQPSNPRV